MHTVITLDLKFLDTPGLIASYLLPHAGGAVLIESGPGSTIPALEKALAENGFTPEQVTDVLVTHIHLDHAGASGWLARRGAEIHVHARGLPHLADPSRLLASAGRIYKDQMDALWGAMLPVPEDQLHPLEDGDIVRIGDLAIRAVDTPGHATHHMALVLDDLCFSGDVGGIRLAGPRYIVLPMPPPEFHLEFWQASCRRLGELGVRRIAPTHFGIYPDAAAHIELLGRTLDDTGTWLEANMPSLAGEALEQAVEGWLADRAAHAGLTPAQAAVYEKANAAVTSAWGIERYWRKYRSEGDSR